MTSPNAVVLPKARKDDLVTRQIPGELLIYDLKRHRAFCLNDTAATIWKNCDGKRTVAELTAKLEKNFQTRIDEQVVWLALDQLEKSRLLNSKRPRELGWPSISRRDLIRTGIVIAIALPVVTMIAAPTAQAAGSPITMTACNNRKPTDPGGCGANPCSDVAGATCQAKNKVSCRCL